MNDEPQVMTELMNVLHQASQQIASEQRHDEELELVDSIRYEQGLIDWRMRLPEVERLLEIRTTSEQLGALTGSVHLSSHQAFVLASETENFLINTAHVVVISGLVNRVKIRASSTTDDYLLRMLLNELCDRQISATWYSGHSDYLHGVCVSVWQDAIDIQTQRKVVTLPLQHLVAARYPK